MTARKYAEGTSVPVERSTEEIRSILKRFGADAFGYVEDHRSHQVAISFEITGRRILVRLTMPNRDDYLKDSFGRVRPITAVDKEYDAECRRLFRSLANGIKAKLAMIDDGISTVEHEFFADLVTRSGQTVGDQWASQVDDLVNADRLPPMMPGALQVIALGAGAGK